MNQNGDLKNILLFITFQNIKIPTEIVKRINLTLKHCSFEKAYDLSKSLITSNAIKYFHSIVLTGPDRFNFRTPKQVCILRLFFIGLNWHNSHRFSKISELEKNRVNLNSVSFTRYLGTISLQMRQNTSPFGSIQYVWKSQLFSKKDTTNLERA